MSCSPNLPCLLVGFLSFFFLFIFPLHLTAPEGTLKQFFINIFEQAQERLFIAGALRSVDRHINGCLCVGAGNYWS